MTREAVIVAAKRTAVGKSKKGTTRNWRSDDMAATVIKALMAEVGDKLDPQEIDDVIIGCAMPEGSQGLNFARSISILAGLPVDPDAGMQPRGYRLLSRVPRLGDELIHTIVGQFGNLQKIMRVTPSELAEVTGMGESRARAVKENLARLAESSILDRYA